MYGILHAALATLCYCLVVVHAVTDAATISIVAYTVLHVAQLVVLHQTHTNPVMIGWGVPQCLFRSRCAKCWNVERACTTRHCDRCRKCIVGHLYHSKMIGACIGMHNCVAYVGWLSVIAVEYAMAYAISVSPLLLPLLAMYGTALLHAARVYWTKRGVWYGYTVQSLRSHRRLHQCYPR